MSRRTSNRQPAGARRGSWFLPLHQDAYFEALATGVVPCAASKPTSLGAMDHRMLRREAHGFDYGVVGLLELDCEPSARGYVLLGDCKAFWLQCDSDRSELEDKLELFEDTVPSALPLRVDAGMFEERGAVAGVVNGELSLPLNEPPQAVEQSSAGDGVTRIVSLSGAIAMARHRCLQLGVPVDSLPGVIRFSDGIARLGGWASSFLVGAVEGVVAAVATSVHASRDELLVVAEAAELLSGMDAAMGIELNDFAARLHERCGRDPGAAATAGKFRETIAKLTDNQLELTTARIDDSGQIGLRALMVFLLAPEPEELLRWLTARTDVGAGVSILAAVFSGLYAGLGRVPRHVKGPEGSSFLSIGLLSESMLGASIGYSMESAWSQQGEGLHVMKVRGLVFAHSITRPDPAVSALLEAVRGAGGVADVNAETGAITVGMSAGGATRTAIATVGPSRWFGDSPVVRLGLRLRRQGKGTLPRELLERLLDPELAPVIASLGGVSGEVVLSAEAALQDRDFIRTLGRVIIALHQRAESLGLVDQAEVIARKRTPARTRKKAAPDAAS
ncbi:hypothetical protein Psesu_2198 [Pseudoxanthomonas suwonensis 11-1]|uniref:Uncharacterized protein n=2 Tax=Pseudoxanthomonas suwonensis TaxID=314722 RepID=E6WV34_PSEUU|nr:hypothetical protein Psesu_2198 [Pseudoxanthomonas suwonensis 11-1]